MEGQKEKNFRASSRDVIPLKKVFRANDGKSYLLTSLRIISKDKILILVDDNFAKYRGYIDRIDLLRKTDQLRLLHDPVYVEAGSGRFLTMGHGYN